MVHHKKLPAHLGRMILRLFIFTKRGPLAPFGVPGGQS